MNKIEIRNHITSFGYEREGFCKIDLKNDEGKKQVPGSVSFVPSVAGLIIAGEVIKDIIK